MHNNFVTAQVRKRIIILAAGLSALVLFVLGFSPLLRLSHRLFFESMTDVSLAALENINTYFHGSVTIDGCVTVTGRMPREKIDGFIKKHGFIQFDTRYTGESRPDGLNEKEEKLWYLQKRIFGFPPSRCLFLGVPKDTPPPNGNVYFLYLDSKKYMFLDRVTGAFWGFVGYGR